MIKNIDISEKTIYIYGQDNEFGTYYTFYILGYDEEDRKVRGTCPCCMSDEDRRRIQEVINQLLETEKEKREEAQPAVVWKYNYNKYLHELDSNVITFVECIRCEVEEEFEKELATQLITNRP